jgi:hypothetical protein
MKECAWPGSRGAQMWQVRGMQISAGDMLLSYYSVSVVIHDFRCVPAPTSAPLEPWPPASPLDHCSTTDPNIK